MRRLSALLRHLAPAALAAGLVSAVGTPGSLSPPSAYAQSAAVSVKLPFEKYRLANGLEVILHEDRRTPVVAFNVWYHVGSKDEATGKNGFAHLFEHVMFQGSRHVGEDQFFRYLERAGASERNGTTNTDRTNYFETVPSNQLETVLWLESDRMAFLLDHVDQATFENQREVVKNERRQSYENAPYGMLHKFLIDAVYPSDHPYHLDTIGTPADLDGASLADVKAFFKTYYLPNNATLVIAGDFDKARTKELIEKYFGPILRGPDPAVKSGPQPVVLTGEKTLKIEADVELPRLYVYWPTPPLFAAGDGELDALSHVLSGGKSSRLHKRLVRDLEMAQDVSAFQGSSQLSSLFGIVVTLKKGKSATDALAIVDEELAKIRTSPPADAEVDRARAQLLSQLVFSNERVTARANQLNTYNQMAGDPGFIDKDAARYQAVKPADVQRAAVAFLPEKKRVVAVVTPTPGAPRAGRLVEAR
jgi:predicted Zn-dependent peptidase